MIAPATPPPNRSERAHLIELAQQIGIYGIGGLITQGCSLILVAFYARSLGATGLGLLALLELAKGVVTSIGDMGLSASLLRFSGAPEWSSHESAMHRTAQVIAGSSGLILILIAYLAVNTIGGLLPTELRGLGPVIVLSVAAGAVANLNLQLTCVLRAKRRAHVVASTAAVKGSVTLAAGLWLVAMSGAGIRGAAVAEMLGECAAWLVVAPRVLTVGSLLNWIKVKPLLQYGIPFVPHSLARLALAQGDRVVIAQALSLYDVGIFTVGQRVGSLAALLTGPIQTAWAPFTYSAAAERSFRRIGDAAFLYVTFLGCASVILGLNAAAIVSNVAGPGYEGAVSVAVIIAAANATLIVHNATSWSLAYANRTGLIPVFTVVTGIATLAATVLLTRRFGVFGAACAALAGQTLQSVLSWRIATRLMPVPYGPAVTAGFTAAIVTIVGLAPRVIENPVLGVALAALCSAATGLILSCRLFWKKPPSAVAITNAS